MSGVRSGAARRPVTDGGERRSGRKPGRRTIAVLVLSYLGGSLPIVYLLGRLAGVDLRRYGSGNVGSHNLSQAAGLGAGLAGWLGDAAKGGLAVTFARRFAGDEVTAGLALLGALAGQCWPPFLRGSGGRGVATFVGGMLTLTPSAAPWPLGTIAAVAGLRPLAKAWGPGGVLAGSAVPVGVLLGALCWPLACAGGKSTRVHMGTAGMAVLLLLLRRITANGWPKAPGMAPVLLSRLLLDRENSAPRKLTSC
jgi:acyl phosphate:glycerol-3-phosphate acyltransferase